MTEPHEKSTDLARCETAAEAAYDTMYDAPRHRVKDCYEDAMRHLASAIEIAKELGDADAVTRLQARQEHIRNVYNHQFRWV